MTTAVLHRREVTTAVADDAPARFEAIFDAQYAGLCRLAWLILGDEGRAEEVVMDAFVHTLAGWRRIRDTERAEAYLRRAVVNGARSAARRRVTEGRANAQIAARDRGSISALDQLADSDPVLRAVRALPPRQRAAVVLRYYADLPEIEVAGLLGCAVGTVKSQLAKAKVSLARALADVEAS